MIDHVSRRVNRQKGKLVSYTGFVNDLFLKKPVTVRKTDLLNLVDSPTAYYVFVSGLMEDDADIEDSKVYFSSGFYDIQMRSKNAQVPNIISAYKLAQTCAYMIENKEFDTISIDYVGVDWQEDKQKGKLVCEGAQHVSLFSVTPDELYINWAAGLQIQFHPHNVDQSWEGSVEEWARAYLRHFVGSAQKRCDTMREKFIEPFLKYVN